ncbi:Dhx8 protein [Chytriomyces sp. MP71]|nr:Dhx8 protein [Chytriomyces sp. MP71]
MAGFPVDPALAKVLIHSKTLHCTAEVISIISMLSVETVFFSPHDKREAANEAKAKFINLEGDHLTLLNVMRGYQAVHGDKEWCIQNFINGRAIKNAMDIHNQLASFCEQAGIPPTSTAGNEVEPILRCFLHGFFTNVATRQMDGSYQTMVGKQVCHVHPSSVLFQKKASLVMFHEHVQTSRQYMRNVSAVAMPWLQSSGSHYFGFSST